MKRLALAVLLASGAALADTTFVTNVVGTNVPSQFDMVTASPTTGNWFTVVGPASGTKSAYSGPIPGSVTLNGTVSMQVSVSWDIATGSKSVVLAAKFRRSGADTLICSATATPAMSGSPGSGNLTASCTASSVSLLAGDLMVLQVSVPTLASAGPDDAFVSTGSNTFVTWPQALFSCPTVGAACACGGICNGNGCGTQFDASGLCGCNCNTAGCTSLSIAGPSLSCVDNLDALHANCSWTSVPGTANYLLDRGAGNLFTGAGTSFTDNPGLGTFTYNVHANGSCTGTLGGSNIASKDSLTGSNTVTIASVFYTIFKAGLGIGKTATPIISSYRVISNFTPGAVGASSCATIATLNYPAGTTNSTADCIVTPADRTATFTFYCKNVAGTPGSCWVVACNMTASTATPPAGNYSCRSLN